MTDEQLKAQVVLTGHITRMRQVRIPGPTLTNAINQVMEKSGNIEVDVDIRAVDEQLFSSRGPMAQIRISALVVGGAQAAITAADAGAD